ncbi:MAG TPA: hypothetical protein VFT01_04470 [Homoserinimonas sp.]|nr:hypothetical protein [Homoserinimonas sp.]
MTVTMQQQRRTAWRRVKYLARRAIGMELGVWLSLYRFVFRRPRVPAGAKGFSYHRPVMSIMIVFIVLSAVEIPIVDLIVHHWLFIRIPFLILGIWGLTFMVGFVFGFLTRPHAVGPDGIRVRSGAEVDIPISWDDIYSVEPNKQVAESAKAPKVTPGDDGDTLHLRIQNETNILIRLERPTVVRLPHGAETVREIRLYADEPKQFMDAVRRHIG